VFTNYEASVLGIDIVFANPSVLGLVDEQKLERVFERYKDRVIIASRSDYKPHPLCLYNNIQHGAIDTIGQNKFRVFQTKPFIYDIAPLCPGTPIYKGNKESISTFSREILDAHIRKVDPFTQKVVEANLEIFDQKETTLTYIDYYSNGRTHE
jgi:hypothetical protein